MVFSIIGYMFHNRNCFEEPRQEDVIHEREVAWQATCHKDVGTPILTFSWQGMVVFANCLLYIEQT